MAAANCDSSSSEDEDRDKFAEIVKSVRLINTEEHSLNAARHHQEFAERNSKPSLRHWRREEGDTNLMITPEFQKHVAKKLTAFLDSSFVMTDVTKSDHGDAQESCEGIQLLSSAKQTLSLATDDNKETSGKKRPPEMYSSGSSEDEEEVHRLAEAAVSGYSIIANGNEDGVTRAENETRTLTGGKDLRHKHERKRKKMKEKKEQKERKSKKRKKKKRHKET